MFIDLFAVQHAIDKIRCRPACRYVYICYAAGLTCQQLFAEVYGCGVRCYGGGHAYETDLKGGMLWPLFTRLYVLLMPKYILWLHACMHSTTMRLDYRAHVANNCVRSSAAGCDEPHALHDNLAAL